MSFTKCSEDTSLVIDIIGLLTGILISIGPLAQLIKIIKTRKTKDISLKWMILYTIGMSGSLLFTNYYKIYPIMIPAIFETTIIITILIYKIISIKFSSFSEKDSSNPDQIVSEV